MRPTGERLISSALNRPRPRIEASERSYEHFNQTVWAEFAISLSGSLAAAARSLTAIRAESPGCQMTPELPATVLAVASDQNLVPSASEVFAEECKMQRSSDHIERSQDACEVLS